MAVGAFHFHPAVFLGASVDGVVELEGLAFNNLA